MASPSSAASPSAFSPSRSLLLKKSSGRFFSSNYTYKNRQLNFSGNGGLSLHRRGGSGSSLSLRVVCLRDFRTPKVTQESWDKLVLKSESPVLVEFYASWCGPCQMVHQVINEIAFEYRGKVHCFMLNTDSDLDIAESYDIKAVPVVLIFKNGKKQESIVGTMPKEFYVAAIEKALGIQV